MSGWSPTRPREAFTLQIALDPGSPVRSHRIVGTLQTSRGEIRRRLTRAAVPEASEWTVLVIVAPGQGAQTPGFLAPWLEDPTFAARFDWLATVAGLDLAHYGTQADAETIRDTRIAQPLLVATGLIAALDVFPHPADTFARIGAVAGHSVGELDRRGRRTGHQRRAGDGAGARAWCRDGRRRRRDAHRHDRRPRWRPRRGAGRRRASRTHRRQRQRSRPGGRRRHDGAAGRVRGRSARQGTVDAAQRRRRLPHQPHGSGRRAPRLPGPLRLDPRPPHSPDLQPRRADRPRRPRGRRAASSGRSSTRCGGTCAWRR